MEIVDNDVAEILRQKTPAEKLAIADSMWRFARNLVAAGLRFDHPDWDESQIQREISRRLSNGAF